MVVGDGSALGEAEPPLADKSGISFSYRPREPNIQTNSIVLNLDQISSPFLNDFYGDQDTAQRS